MSDVDEVFSDRARAIAVLARMALALGMAAGLAPDPRERNPDYEHVVLIDLEGIGQVSWHIHIRDLMHFAFLGPYDGTWDGHGTKERDRRLEVFSKTFFPRPRKKS